MDQAAMHTQKLHFVWVGIVNTAIDFALLNACVFALHLPLLAANIIATSIAMTFSFAANRRFVFKITHKPNAKEVLLFIAITLAGLWGVQSVILGTIVPLAEHIWPGHTQGLYVNIAKGVATVATAIWNFTLYKHVAFTGKETHDEQAER